MSVVALHICDLKKEVAMSCSDVRFRLMSLIPIVSVAVLITLISDKYGNGLRVNTVATSQLSQTGNLH